MTVYKEITGCRICHAGVRSVLSLGEQALSGVFPEPGESVDNGPLDLVECVNCCHVQLRHQYNPDLLFGDSYGYRSGLNEAMVEHLGIVSHYATKECVEFHKGDIVLDIGSNDGTLLGCFPRSLDRIGIDPLAAKFSEHYDKEVFYVSAMFSAEAFEKVMGRKKKAKLVTSLACFYDLEDPIPFVCEILEVLADDGAWICEVSFLPAMCEAHSFDTICHEHASYYRLADFFRIASSLGLRVIDAQETTTNGGSLLVTMVRVNSRLQPHNRITRVKAHEDAWEGYDGLARFAQWTSAYPERLLNTLYVLPGTILGYGASTKGNVLLNYCRITANMLPAIADRNPDKVGRQTPGSQIPIVSEEWARDVLRNAEGGAFFFVLPWHFREGIVKREAKFLDHGGVLIFPLPEIGFEI